MPEFWVVLNSNSPIDWYSEGPRRPNLPYQICQVSDELQENDAAMEKLTKLLELNPEDKSAKAEVTKLKRQQAASEAKMKGTFKKMFG